MSPNDVDDPSESHLRPLFARLGPITRADGSAQLSCGATTVLCGVYGPAEVRPHLERTDRAAVEVVYRRKVGEGARVADRAREALVRGVLEAALLLQAHPRTAVHLALQQLDDAGAELACCLNAACLALVDASLPMRSLFAAVTVAVIKSEEGGETMILVVDPTLKEQRSAEACVTLAFDSVNGEILASHLEGRCSERQFQECLAAAKEASRTVFDFYRECLTKKFSKELKQ